MSKMIPSTYVTNGSSGEGLLFDRLRDDPDTKGWFVFHSLNIRRHVSKKEGELDFLVLIPDLGILCIEVKAARFIHRSLGNWFYGDNSTPDSSGPFSQVASARESVHRYLKEKDPVLGKTPCFSVVIFTHCNFSDTDIGFMRDDYLNKRDVYSSSISSLLITVMNKRLDEFSEKYNWFNRNECHLKSGYLEQVAKILRGDFEVYISPKDRSNEVYDELNKFTDQQFKVLDAIDENPRVLVKGAAGTGKTFIGIEACRRAAEKGKKVLFLCFNNALGHVLKREFDSLSDNVWAGTLHSYMREVSGVPINNQDELFWNVTLPESAFDAIEEPIFDFLVVDEAQDVLQENYLLFLSICLKGSLSDGNWLMLGDFCNQNIYIGYNGLDILKRNYGHITTAVLRDNCRNTPRIVETFKQICGLNESFYQSILRADNGEDAHWQSYDSESAQIALLKAVIKRQRKKYPDSEIVILSPSKDGCAGKILDTFGNGIFCNDVNKSNVVRYTTIHSFKGLEAQSIILTDMEEFIGDRAEKLFYVAVSRATSEITVLYDKSSVGQLMTILSKDA